jgi:hypothetical protein
MSERDQLYPLDRRVWLLAIGRRLRVEYDAIAEPVPPHLVALVKQLEMPAQGSGQETSRSARAADHPVPPRSDWDARLNFEASFVSTTSPKKFVYVGRVGTGWEPKTARAIRRAPLARPKAPLAKPLEKASDDVGEPRCLL